MPYTVVDNPAEYFNTKLYTGDGTGAKAITGVGFQPDLVWLKTRSTAFHHQLHDRVRGATAGAIYSSLTNAQDSNYPITSFDSDGFTLGNSASLIADSFGSQNGSGTTMCAWNWKANGAGVSNTAGTISSTVSANTTSGFSIVSYTATSGTSSIGHGLGVAPSMIILKTRNQTGNWITGLSVNGWDKYLTLDTTNANVTDDRMFSPSAGTDPTSTLFWSNQSAIGSAGTMIAYCFAEVKGFSKFGSYTGNGSTDGTFVYTGFKPAFVLHKVTSTTEPWIISDNKRDTYNVIFKSLRPSSSAAETTNENVMDFISNGFKLRTTNLRDNGSGSTYIYMAFAENPFVSSKGIPTTAR